MVNLFRVLVAYGKRLPPGLGIKIISLTSESCLDSLNPNSVTQLLKIVTYCLLGTCQQKAGIVNEARTRAYALRYGIPHPKRHLSHHIKRLFLISTFWWNCESCIPSGSILKCDLEVPFSSHVCRCWRPALHLPLWMCFHFNHLCTPGSNMRQGLLDI